MPRDARRYTKGCQEMPWEYQGNAKGCQGMLGDIPRDARRCHGNTKGMPRDATFLVKLLLGVGPVEAPPREKRFLV